MLKSRLFPRLIRGAMVACFALGSCLIVTTGCQENGKACPSTCKQTCAKECDKPCPKKCAKPCAKKTSDKPCPKKAGVSEK